MKRLIVFFLCFTAWYNSYSQVPVINSFSPSSGNTGTSVTINGDNFGTTVENNIVYFAGVKAQVTSATPNRLTILIPKTGSVGTFNVLNKTTGLAVSATNSFITTYSRKDRIYASDFDIESTRNIGSFISSIIASDLDGDGKKDLIFIKTGTGSGSISILSNTSTSELLNSSSFSTSINLPTKYNAESLAIADMDGDGKPDIIVVENGVISILKNNISSGISAEAFTRTEVISNNDPGKKLAVSDMDGDGRPDILIGTIGITIYKNNCSPNQILDNSFASKTTISGNGDIGRIIVTDMNNDGKPEILTSGGVGNFINIFYNGIVNRVLSSDAFSLTRLDVASNSVLAIADIDGDGKKDLAIAQRSAKYLCIYKNIYESGKFTNSSISLMSKYYIGNDPWDIVTDDIDGDGKIDIMTTSVSDSRVSIFKNIYSPADPNKPWFENITFYSFSNSPYTLLSEDLNNDGTPDLIALNRDNSITFRKNKESLVPTIASIEPIMASVGATITISGHNFGETIADNVVLFAGRRAEIISASNFLITVKVPLGAASALVSVENKNSKRTARYSRLFKYIYIKSKDISAADFGFRLRMTMPPDYLGNKIQFKDLDADGFPDMIYRDEDKKVIIQKNSGSGNIDCALFGDKITFTTNVGDDAFRIEDLDNDGLPDILVWQQMNTLFYKNRSTIGNIIFDGAISLPPMGLNAIDIDGDGKIDFFPYRNVTGENTAGLAFKKIMNDYISPIDINGDGKPDIHTYNNLKLDISLNKAMPGMVSDSLFQKVAAVPCGFNYKFKDLNNDGKPDILFNEYYIKNTGTSASSISFSDKTALVTIPNSSSAASFYTSDLLYIDLNGDGLDDAILEKNAFLTEWQDTLFVYQNKAVGIEDPKYDGFIKFNARNEAIYPTATISTPTLEDFIDLNNDGKADMIWRSDRNSLIFFENTTFPEEDTPPVITSFSPAMAAIKSKVTITGANFNPVLEKNLVYFGTVNAKIISGSTIQLIVEVPPGGVYDFISVLNVENKLRATTTKYFTIQLGTGNGAAFTDVSFKLKENLFVRPQVYSTTAADLDNDGTAEIVVGATNADKKFTIYKAGSSDADHLPENFNKAREIDVDKASYYMKIADLDGDGKPEVITLNDKISIYENTSTKACSLTFLPDILDDNTRFQRFYLGDVNNDGKIDIVAPDVGPNLRIYLNNSKRGSISFDPYTRVVLPIDEMYSTSWGYELADLDNDGLIDLIVSGSNGTKRICVFRNTTVPGSNTLTFAPPFYRGIAADAGHIVARDFDGDGKTDLISLQYKYMLLLRNTSTTGNINFEPTVSIATDFPAQFVDSGDFNGDGKPDLAIASVNEENPAIYFYKNIAKAGIFDETSFSKPLIFTLPQVCRIATISDFNKDGKADLLLVNAGQKPKSPALLMNQILSSDLILTTSDGFTNYTSKLPAVAIDPDVTVMNKGTEQIMGATVKFIDGFDEGDLIALKTDASTENIVGVYDKIKGQLNLSSTSNTTSFAQWQTALRKVTYLSTSNSKGEKTIGFSVTSAAVQSLLAMKIIKVIELPLPILKNFIPKVATDGMTVTILGENFDNLTSVDFAAVKAESFTSTANEIKAIVGNGASGDITISTPAGSAVGKDFIYVPTPKLIAKGKTTFFQGESIELRVLPETGYSYIWKKNGVKIPGVVGSSYTASESAAYQVEISDHGLTLASNLVEIEAIYNLPADNFKISTSSVTCKGNNNGSIILTAEKNLNYTLKLVNGLTVNTKLFTTGVTINDLPAGTYTLCITIDNQNNYKQCFEAVVAEPKALTLYASINQSDKKVALALTGAANYNLLLNGKAYNSASGQLSLPLNNGINSLSVSSDLPCQGVLNKTFIISDKINIRPNPVERLLYINLPNETSQNVNVKIFNTMGVQLYNKDHQSDGDITLDLQNLVPGMYILKIKMHESESIIKFLKN